MCSSESKSIRLWARRDLEIASVYEYTCAHTLLHCAHATAWLYRVRSQTTASYPHCCTSCPSPFIMHPPPDPWEPSHPTAMLPHVPLYIRGCNLWVHPSPLDPTSLSGTQLAIERIPYKDWEVQRRGIWPRTYDMRLGDILHGGGRGGA